MTREDIVNSARALATQIAKSGPKSTWTHDYAMTRIMELVDAAAVQEREAFAKIQHESLLQAMRIEREACAELRNKFHPFDLKGRQEIIGVMNTALDDYQAAIRARGDKHDTR